MNLHKIVRNAISSVNPETRVTIKKFSSFEVDEAGKVINKYNSYNPDVDLNINLSVKAQIQPIAGEKLEHLYNYNSSNIYVKMFINGEEHGLSEALSTNGDIVIFDDKVWKIVEVSALWKKSGWNEVILCLQNDKSLTDEANNGREYF